MGRAIQTEEIQSSTGVIFAAEENRFAISEDITFDDLQDNELITKSMANTLGINKTIITKSGEDIDTDGNISFAGELPDGVDFLSSYIDNEPDRSPHFLTKTGILDGFDPDISDGAVIEITFI